MLLQMGENSAADQFATEHYELHQKTASVILTAEQTGLGYVIKVECPYCRKTKDITEYEMW